MVEVSIGKGDTYIQFEAGMIDKVSSNINGDIDQNAMPGAGPLSNLGIDINGVGKTITVSGNISDAQGSTVLFTTLLGTTPKQYLRDKEIIKMWMEALLSGAQTVFSFYSNREKYSVRGMGSSTITDPVSGALITFPVSFGAANLDMIPATTKVYVISLVFDDENGNPELIPFTLSLWVAGS